MQQALIGFATPWSKDNRGLASVIGNLQIYLYTTTLCTLVRLGLLFPQIHPIPALPLASHSKDAQRIFNSISRKEKVLFIRLTSIQSKVLPVQL